jgi:peroxiredoxin
MIVRLLSGSMVAVMLTSSSPAGIDEATPVPLDRMVGSRLADFWLKDARTGQFVRLYTSFGAKAVVIVFTGVDCPVGNLYMPRLVELYRTYKPQGVVFFTINANPSESIEQVAAHAKEYGLEFPALKDERGRVAWSCDARRTCEALILDGRAIVRYRGAIDDQYGLGTRKDEPEHRYVADVLDAILARKPVTVAATEVVGCPIERTTLSINSPDVQRVRPAAAALLEGLKEAGRDERVDVGSVNFAEHVAPILHAKCASCHRPRQAAPFSLLSYDDARRWAPSIAEVVEDRRMPPWHADPRHGTFSNDRSLDVRQRSTLLAWVDQGAPLGDAAKVPAPPDFPAEWSVGTPDVVFEIPQAYKVVADGGLPYQRFVVPTNFTEDKWVQSIECIPSERSVVHHIICYLIVEGENGARGREHLGGYAPGDMPSDYEPGTAKRIPAGSKLLLEIHYTPIGKEKTDRSKVGFIFAKEPPRKRAYTFGIANEGFRIPPNADNHPVDETWVVPRDVDLLAFMPHMHLRGKDFRYTAIFPGEGDPRERTKVLLSVPAYDFGWQSYYRLAQPIRLPKGTKLLCESHFDNSSKNLANPDPNVPVVWGEQTWDEMMIGYIDISYDLSEPGKVEDDADFLIGARRRNARVPQVLQALAGRRPEGAVNRTSQPDQKKTSDDAVKP